MAKKNRQKKNRKKSIERRKEKKKEENGEEGLLKIHHINLNAKMKIEQRTEIQQEKQQ